MSRREKPQGGSTWRELLPTLRGRLPSLRGPCRGPVLWALHVGKWLPRGCGDLPKVTQPGNPSPGSWPKASPVTGFPSSHHPITIPPAVPVPGDWAAVPWGPSSWACCSGTARSPSRTQQPGAQEVLPGSPARRSPPRRAGPFKAESHLLPNWPRTPHAVSASTPRGRTAAGEVCAGPG